MSKIYILKTYPNDLRSPEPIPIDIDEFVDDYNDYLADWFVEESDKGHKEGETYKSAYEYLQERMK